MTIILGKVFMVVISLFTPAQDIFDTKQPSPEVDSILRRSFIAAAVASIVNDSHIPAYASPTPTANLECLKDLPPLAKDKVRLFLCRHGETEINRLGLVQGSKIDAELNPIGELQAARLGQALALSNEHPPAYFHSPLRRAKQTAVIAAAQYHVAADYYDYQTKKETVQVLSDLREIEFGISFDDESIETRNLALSSTYAAWASGNIDKKLSTDGESMRDILQRVSNSLYQMQRAASNNPDRSIIAVSHSSFLRVILAICEQKDILTPFKTMQLANCCINVVDLPLARFGLAPTRRITSSTLLGEPLSHTLTKFNVQVEKSTVVRLSEQQHLFGVQQVDCTIPNIES